jgi:cobyrinic acid a,c-diamide synthase
MTWFFHVLILILLIYYLIYMTLVIGGERSGVGKTTITLALLSSLCRRMQDVQSFKVGPDYIDPMFHSFVTKKACRNLDPVLTSEAYVQKCFNKHIQHVEYAIVEGVMGLYDGIDLNYGSTAHIAKLLDLPVLLVIDCSRLSNSVAAIAYGYSYLDPEIKIAGLVLNRVGSDRHLELLKNALQPLGFPILGVFKRENDISIPDRHLGLIPTAELPGLNKIIQKLADLGDTCFDWDKLLPLIKTNFSETSLETTKTQRTRRNEELRETNTQENSITEIAKISKKFYLQVSSKIPIAVAYDEAFNFYYQDNLDLLEELGAKLIFWSPLKDSCIPQGVKGMYFGGGFPEVFAEELSENKTIRFSVKNAIISGIPTIAECGGLMYLCQQIMDFTGKSWPMVGMLPTNAVMDNSLNLGYRRALAVKDSLLFKKENIVCGHEFHRSSLTISPNQPLFQTSRVDSGESIGFEGWSILRNLHASYIHLHWGANPQIPMNFLSYA